jgi:hypothetical protein
MVTKRGVVKVMDFGIARAMQSGVTSMTQTGMVVGTPQYLSPEQALGRGVDERSDLYSVGCMLFELLTGRLPFDADSPLAMAYQHVQETPPAPSSFNSALGPAIDALVARALRKNPAERFPTADAMHDETDRVLAGTARNTMPLITGTGTATGRGEGVAASVFPSAGGQVQTPPPHIQTPYAPTPSPYGPATPSTPPPSAYGYPQQGPQTPPPTPAYNMAPTAPVPQQRPGGPGGPAGTGGGHGGGGGRSANMPVIIGSIVAAAAVAIIIVIVVAMSGGGGGGNDAGGNGPSTPPPTTTASTAPTSTTGADSIVKGDQSRTIDSSQCTNAHNDLINPNKPNVMTMPNVQFLYVDSVVACFKAAGWPYTIKHVDEQQWGQGTVTDQSPKYLADYDPKSGKKITIWVSTGKGAS